MTTFIAARIRPPRFKNITVGSLPHQILLALRGPGGMTNSQIYTRFSPGASTVLSTLRRLGLIRSQGSGKQDGAIHLTEAGRELVHPDGPLSRRKTLNTYCPL